MGLNSEQLENLKEKIYSEKERLAGTFEEFNTEKFKLNNDDRFDEVDQAASDYARSQMLRFRNRDHFYFKKLNKAIEKIECGEYGTCEECDAEIKYERLFARPTAELCIHCKDEAEREEFSNVQGRKSKSIGQAVNLVSSI